MKIIKFIKGLFLIMKWLNVFIILFVFFVFKIECVVDIFKFNWNSVRISSKDGNIDSFKGFFIFMEMSSISSVREMLIMIKIFNNYEGNGIISIMIISIIFIIIGSFFVDINFFFFIIV